MGIDSEDDDVLYSANMGYDTQNRTLIGGEAKNLDEIMNKPRDRMKKTLGLCAAFVGLGLSVAVLGPTLRSLKVQVGASSMENMAIVFSGRGLGYLGGTIAGGAFFECWNSQVLIAVGLGLASFGMAIVAFTKHLPILVIMMSGVGIAMGVLDTGANVVCIKMWGKKASAFLQMLHFGFALGAFLAPLLATPFLRGDLAVNPNISCVVETEQHLDLCEKYICDHGGHCKINDNGKATCTCTEGFTGEHCTDIKCSDDGYAPCKNGGTCIPKEGETKASCQCPGGFTGVICDEQKQCETNPCKNGGNCTIEKDEKEICSCTGGFTGEHCEEPKQCNKTTCANDGTCNVEDDGTETCTCKVPFTGVNCTEEEHCKEDACQNGGTCNIGSNNEETCACPEGFTGEHCEAELCKKKCQNGGLCQVKKDKKETCHCLDGFTGEDCGDMKCSGDAPCKNGATCIPKGDKEQASCKCQDGFTGILCDAIQCIGNVPCLNNGTCVSKDEDNTTMCECVAGFTGELCEVVNCSRGNPCLHGGDCVPKQDEENEYECKCTVGFTGVVCEECKSSYCQNGGTCTVIEDEVICTCRVGFTGDLCQECDTNYCRHDGKCKIVDNEVYCICKNDTLGDHCEKKCVTQKGSTGEVCNCVLGFTGEHCDECDPNYCQNGGNITCTVPTDEVTCACSPGFTGDRCEECDADYCQNGGTCGITGDKVTCTCEAGFTGEVCDIPPDNGRRKRRDTTLNFSRQKRECDSAHCQNGGTCEIDDNDEVICNCLDHFSGDICDKCDPVYCQNGGTCHIEDDGQVMCKCTDGFTGDVCEECDPAYCQNGGSCYIDDDGQVMCNCADGFTGEVCGAIDCSASPCLHGTECVPKEGTTEAYCNCTEGLSGFICEKCDENYCQNGGTCKVNDNNKVECTCPDGFTGKQCKEKVAPTGFRGVYIIISLYLASICILFCYFTYISPIASEATTQQKASSDRPSYENQILMLLFCFYLIYVGSEVSFGGYISEYYQAVFKDCHGSLATAWFWGTFSLGRGLAICFATVMTPMKMLVADLAGGVIATVILLWVGDVSLWFWVGTGLLGLSMASMFPAGIAWLEGYVDVSGKVASVLVTGGVLGEMLIPLTVGYVMFDEKEGLEEQVYPDRLMYLMCGVCIGSSLIFGYVYMLARDMGLKNTHTNQHSVTDVIDGMNDAFSMRNMNTKGPKQMKKSMKFGKKHKV